MPSALPVMTPMRLTRARHPFDAPDWLFEVKHDGFCALAYVENGTCRLISRNGYTFSGFKPLCDGIARLLTVTNAIIDGEICCLGTDRRSMFNQLLFRKGVPRFYAFDLLWLNNRDLRRSPLLKRKAKLERILPVPPGPILYVSHIEAHGTKLFEEACRYHLEGIEAKRKDSIAVKDSSERHSTAEVCVRSDIDGSR